jgi:hypothetical protein
MRFKWVITVFKKLDAAEFTLATAWINRLPGEFLATKPEELRRCAAFLVPAFECAP